MNDTTPGLRGHSICPREEKMPRGDITSLFIGIKVVLMCSRDEHLSPRIAITFAFFLTPLYLTSTADGVSDRVHGRPLHRPHFRHFHKSMGDYS